MAGDDPHQMTLGDLIDTLSRLDPRRMIMFEFGGCFPTEFQSYRGADGERAIGFSSKGGCVTRAEDLLNRAKTALETRFMGWNEEEHTPSRSTLLWAAKSGCISSTAVVRMAPPATSSRR